MPKRNLTADELLTKRGEFIRDMFGAIAHIYDAMNSILSLMFDRRWRNAAAREARLAPDACVLDVCCGTGKQGLQFVKTLGDKARVIGADFCRKMILAGARRMNRKKRSQIAFVEADTLLLPFADGAFDAVSASFGLRNLADLKKGIQEMVRVVRPGGRVVILDFARPRKPIFRQVYEFYFTRIVPTFGRAVHRGHMSPYEYLPKSVLRFVTAQELAEMLARNGVTDIRTRELTWGIAALNIGTTCETRMGEATEWSNLVSQHGR